MCGLGIGRGIRGVSARGWPAFPSTFPSCLGAFIKPNNIINKNEELATTNMRFLLGFTRVPDPEHFVSDPGILGPKDSASEPTPASDARHKVQIIGKRRRNYLKITGIGMVSKNISRVSKNPLSPHV